MPFPNTVQNQQAQAVAGDFASTNPFASVLSGAGQLVAPPGGLIVGNFAWVRPDGTVSQSYVSGAQLGFLGRNEQGLITTYLGDSTLVVPVGFMVVLFNEGDFWATFASGASPGQQVYADEATGAPIAGSASSTATASAGFVGTGTLVSGSTTLTVAAVTSGILSAGDIVTGTAGIPANTTIVAQLTAAAAGTATLVSGSTTLTVATLTSGYLNNGTVITQTGVPAGATIVQQLSGTPGGVGTYVLSAAATTTVSSAAAFTGASPVVAGVNNGGGAGTYQMSAAATATVGTAQATTSNSTVLNVTARLTGGLNVGDPLTGTGVAAGTTITATITGVGGVGTYRLSGAAQAFGPTTVTNSATNLIATPWTVRGTDTAAPGQIAKISTN